MYGHAHNVNDLVQLSPNLVPRACVPLPSANAVALGNSKTRTRNFWFQFDCAHRTGDSG